MEKYFIDQNAARDRSRAWFDRARENVQIARIKPSAVWGEDES